MTRHEILKKSDEIVNGNREQDYGSPEDNFSTIAQLWNSYIHAVKRDHLTAHDVAAMMILMKVARVSAGNAKDDNWIDIAGYAACGGELQDSRNFQTIRKAG